MKRYCACVKNVPSIVLLMLSIAAFPGCRHGKSVKTASPEARSGEVQESMIESDASSRYVIEPGMSYESPVVLGDYPLPIYPSQRLVDRLPPVEVSVRIIVGTDGLVTRIDPLGIVNESTRAFYDATTSTLSTWEFSPFRIVENSTGSVRVLPFHQDYRFMFRQVDGVPQIDRK